MLPNVSIISSYQYNMSSRDITLVDHTEPYFGAAARVLRPARFCCWATPLALVHSHSSVLYASLPLPASEALIGAVT